VISDVGTMRATWTSPDGQVLDLTNTTNDSRWFTTQGPGGWGSNPIEIITDPVPRGGDAVRFIRAQPRRITWPLHIWGEDHQDFIDNYRLVMKAFTQTTRYRTPGLLTVARPDGRRRQIAAYFETGFGGESGENWTFANPVLTLFCPDGYWADVEPTVIRRSGISGAPTSFYNPFFTLSPSQVLGETTVTIPGDVESWPEWTITGPMQRLVAANTTLGVQFVLNYTLTVGQQIRITTNRPTVRGPGDANLTGALDWPSAVLWPLAPGTNNITFQVDQATAVSVIEIAYYARYEGA
jgi:hypothetical protein